MKILNHSMQISMFFQTILGFRDFSKIEDFKNEILKKENVAENIQDAQPLLFFSTKKQKTWLLCTNLYLYCILDDVGADSFEVRWNISKSEVFDVNGDFILNVEVDPEFSLNSGKIHFGPLHRNWLYSKNLYPIPTKLRHDVCVLTKGRML